MQHQFYLCIFLCLYFNHDGFNKMNKQIDIQLEITLLKIENKLDRIEERLDKLDKHINFIDDVYQDLKNPINVATKFFGRR